MRRLALLAAAIVVGVSLPQASAGTALVIADPKGDANFSGIHKQASLPASHAPLDLTTVTFDTVKAKVAGKLQATALKITLATAAPPSTTPGASYGVTGTHSACGQLRLQIYYGEAGPNTYGDLAECGTGGVTSGTQYAIEFAPKIVGQSLILEIPFKALPKEFKVGSSISEVTAYTSTAEFVVAGYQPTDFEPSAGIDIATAAAPWKVA